MGTETEGSHLTHSENKAQRALVLVAARTLGSCLPFTSLCLLPYGYTMAAVIPYVRLKFKARRRLELDLYCILIGQSRVVQPWLVLGILEKLTILISTALALYLWD